MSNKPQDVNDAAHYARILRAQRAIGRARLIVRIPAWQDAILASEPCPFRLADAMLAPEADGTDDGDRFNEDFYGAR